MLTIVIWQAKAKSYWHDGFTSYTHFKQLKNTYNNAFVMGTTKYSYTDMVMDIIQEFDSQNLKENSKEISKSVDYLIDVSTTIE